MKSTASEPGLSLLLLTFENDSNALRVDANIFENEEKYFCLKNIRIRVDQAFVFPPKFFMALFSIFLGTYNRSKRN